MLGLYYKNYVLIEVVIFMSLTPLNTNRLQTQTVEPCFNTEIIKLFKKNTVGWFI